MAVVYCIRDKLTGKCYVGKSIRPDKRWKEHCAAPASLIGRVIASSGVENFELSILETVSDEDAYACEGFWIVKLGTIWPGGYNVAGGAKGPRKSVRIADAVTDPAGIQLTPVVGEPKDVPFACDCFDIPCGAVCDLPQVMACRVARARTGYIEDAMKRARVGIVTRGEEESLTTGSRRA